MQATFLRKLGSKCWPTDPVLAAKLVIVLAMARRDVDKPSAVLFADESAGEQRN